MYFSIIKNYDIANGPGCRVSLFVSGCSNKCKGCFQPETWDPKYGHLFTKNVQDGIFDMVNNDNINGLTILGGDPFFYKHRGYGDNITPIKKLVLNFREKFNNTKDIWVYTGYTIEYLLNYPSNYGKNIDILDILNNIDFLVDGPFDQKLKDPSLQFRGSANQRIIDMNKTRKSRFTKLYTKNRLEDKKYIIIPLK